MANKKILIIEDDVMLRGLITKKLTEAGYEVSSAVDGEKGLAAVKSEMPDLVLLDLILPNLNGFEVLEKVKDDKAIAHVPVIIISNLNQKEDMDRCLRLGAVGYITKAFFTSDEIITKIQEVLK